MKKRIKRALAYKTLLLLIIVMPSCSFGQSDNKIALDSTLGESCNCFIYDSVLHAEGWDLLPQTIYWQAIMNLTPDSAMVSISHNRQMLEIIESVIWDDLSDLERTAFKDHIKQKYDLSDSLSIYVTKGKNNFYEFTKVKPSITKAITVFESQGIDPWYAQAILLIESPGKTHLKSPAGANGPFQLMRSVARNHGIIVNEKIDERTDIDKAALAASRLLNRICIPKVREMLDREEVKYEEKDLWFRLLVLHAYHAGAGNLGGVIRKINPTEGGLPLIQDVWCTTYRGFRNSSQNYSQLALAAYCSFHTILQEEAEEEAKKAAALDWQ